MNDKEIPKNEMANFLSVYWQMLAEIEAKTDPEKDVLNKILVEGAYNVLRRSNIINRQARWNR